MGLREKQEPSLDDEHESMSAGGVNETRLLDMPLRITALAIAVLLSILSIIQFERRIQNPFPVPTAPPPEICGEIMSRPSWHDLPLHRRHAYTRAVQTLASQPSRLGLNTSRYDDFTYVHVQQVWQTHHAAISLPYHRYFVAVFERILQKEGGYDGPMPFWDWTLDAEQPLDSPIWDSWAGFGGNGSAKSGCVENGVFARVGKIANYSEAGYDPHCVTRSFAQDDVDGVLFSKQWTGGVIDKIVQTSKSYDEFRTRLEDGPHRYLHRGIGGEMPSASSTNGISRLDIETKLTNPDHLFFLHHAQIDRLWWMWQQKSQSHGVDYSGPSIDEDHTVHVGSAKTSDMIHMLGLAPDIQVADVLKTDTGILCYKHKIKSL